MRQGVLLPPGESFVLKDHVISRLAAAALIAIFIVTGVLTLSSARSIRQNRARSDEARVMSARFAEASHQAEEVERYIVLWTESGDPVYLVEQNRAQEAFAAVLDSIALTNRPEDREFADWAKLHFGEISHVFDRLLESPPPPFEELLGEYAVAYTSLYESVAAGDIGDPALAEQLIDPAGVTDASQLTSNPVAVIMSAKAAERDTTTFKALRAIGASEERFRTLAPLLYVVGTLLAMSLLAIMIRYGKQAAVTEETTAQLRRLSTTDALTELGNRRGFDEATRRLATTPDGVPVSLIVMDLDDFKVVNDTYGHAGGDAILKTFGALLARLAPPGVSRFRTGGDEFALLAHGLDATASMALARRIRSAAVAELGAGVSVTAGVAMLDTRDKDESLLRQKADAALYEGKLRGRNVVVLYTDQESVVPVFPVAKLHAVRRLLDEGRIKAVFQPIWNLETGAIFGYEGLSRPNADYGLSGPEEAFDVAQQFGLAMDLDRLCLATVFDAARLLPEEVRIFLNLSPSSLTHTSFSPRELVSQFEEAGFSRDRLVVEVTEKSRVPPAAIADAVASLRAEGVRVALDDVGAGNNGLEMLRRVQVDFVKIDRTVVVAAAETAAGRAVLAAILAFCNESGSLVVAEGIENASTMATVLRASKAAAPGAPALIYGVQGFLFGRPAPASLASIEAPPLLAA